MTATNSIAHESASWRRVSRQRPCRICGHDDWCEYKDDGTSHCMRSETGGYPSEHRMGGRWYPPDGAAETAQVVRTPAPPSPRSELADVQTRDRINLRILELCPLSESDRTYLTGPSCGLSEDALVGQFGTMPRPSQQGRLLSALVQEFGFDTLQTIPGIVEQGGHLRFVHSGLLVAVRDAEGHLVAFQVRLGPGDYRWLSAPGGPSSGAPAHVARPREVRDHRVYVVESPKSAVILAGRFGAVVIGVGGHANYKAALGLLEHLRDHEDADAVVIAFDADDAETKPLVVRQVERSRQALGAAAVGLGYAVRIARWDHADGKGPDDCLIGGHSFTREVYVVTPVEVDASPVEPLDAASVPGMLVSIAYQYAVLAKRHEDLQRWQFAICELLTNESKTADKETGKRRSTLSPADRVVGSATYLAINRAPGVDHGDKPAEVPVYRAEVARMAGVSEDQVSRSWIHLDKLRYIRKRVVQVSRDVREVRIAAGSRVIPHTEQFDVEAVHRKRARERPCPECGSTALVRRTYCAGCGCKVDEKTIGADDVQAAAAKVNANLSLSSNVHGHGDGEDGAEKASANLSFTSSGEDEAASPPCVDVDLCANLSFTSSSMRGSGVYRAPCTGGCETLTLHGGIHDGLCLACFERVGARAGASGRVVATLVGAALPPLPLPPRAVGPPCRYVEHRGSEWQHGDGRWLCGICHPPYGAVSVEPGRVAS